MLQYNMKQGVKTFGDKGKQAVLNELQQLHDRDVGEPVHKNAMGNDEIKCTLRYLMFLKEKKRRVNKRTRMRRRETPTRIYYEGRQYVTHHCHRGAHAK